MEIAIAAAVCAFAYFFGAIPFALIIGKLHGVDIRKVGSGNVGATNVTRAVGPLQGKICFVLDLLKGAIPVLAAQVLLPGQAGIAIAAGAIAIAGHMFPVYLKFKGGKGVSTGAGAALALAPLPLLCALALWVILFLATRYVSVASIIAAAALPVAAFFFRLGKIGSLTARSLPVLIFFCIIAAVTVYRHRSNIKRLMEGTENRFEKKRSTSSADDPKEEA
ncbi:MAG: glycerol-3-phosphate 1-O-acyltransferase PlsY [Lentisphaeria bacterium]|nr:glycerol-3-phosphate 1-O-acyltransferase PlsY [Lentisphaeria bacterium]